jgi:hypothetical protein
MVSFAVIEVEDGLTIVELKSGESAEDAALAQGAVLIDPGPYATFEEANDALDQIRVDDREED